MKKLTCQRLSESWVEQATKQKVNEKLEMDIEKLKTMWQLRLKWKTNPTFSTWLEVQDPIHRHSWTPVDLHKSNIYNHYDFHNQIPDTLTRERAESDPTYMEPRVKTLRENDFFSKKYKGTTPVKSRSIAPSGSKMQRSK